MQFDRSLLLNLSRFPVRMESRPLAAQDILVLTAICAIALLLRCLTGWQLPSIGYPDETWNYLEQAFRLAFGYGVRVWSYDIGLRSYLFPAILAGVMRVSDLLVNNPNFSVGSVTLFMSCLSLSIVVASYLWGRMAGGFLGAVIVGVVSAVWYQLIYFAPHALSEVFATNLLVTACLIVSMNARGVSRWQDMCVGILLAMTIFVRVQCVPAAGVLLLWVIWQRGLRGSLAVLACFGMAFIALGFCDWLTYDYPFQSLIMNALVNTVGGVSTGYGVSPVYWYLDMELHYDGGLAILIAFGCIAGGLRMPLLLLEMLAILIPHSLVGHKEYRFIYPAIPFMVTLAAIATTDLVELIARTLRSYARPMIAAIAIGVWAGGSWAQATEGPFRREWFDSSGEIAAARWISEVREVCGIGAYKIHLSALAGLVRFHHDVPLVVILTPDHFGSASRSFNVALAPDDDLPADPDFRLEKCWANGFNDPTINRRMPHVCVLRRLGSCQPGAESDPDPESPKQFLRQPWRGMMERLEARSRRGREVNSHFASPPKD